LACLVFMGSHVWYCFFFHRQKRFLIFTTGTKLLLLTQRYFYTICCTVCMKNSAMTETRWPPFCFWTRHWRTTITFVTSTQQTIWLDVFSEKWDIWELLLRHSEIPGGDDPITTQLNGTHWSRALNSSSSCKTTKVKRPHN
jgi:hypothetical protein